MGRPNVGKSTLFNRVIGERRAIVEDRARTTRDRLYGVTEWNDRRFVVVDTGGLEVDPGDAIEEKVQEQARLAIEEADVIVFVVDAATGATPADEEVAETLRLAPAPRGRGRQQGRQREAGAARARSSSVWAGRTATPSAPSTVVASATCSMPSCGRCRRSPATSSTASAREARADELAELEEEGLVPDCSGGCRRPMLEGLGRGRPESGPSRTRWRRCRAATHAPLAIVGRPNVGKWSLLNSLLGEERAIVSDIPGTTRDAIDTSLEWQGVPVRLVDTAGLRRRGKVAAGPAAERYSALRALQAIGRADVACWSSTRSTG